MKRTAEAAAVVPSQTCPRTQAVGTDSRQLSFQPYCICFPRIRQTFAESRSDNTSESVSTIAELSTALASSASTSRRVFRERTSLPVLLLLLYHFATDAAAAAAAAAAAVVVVVGCCTHGALCTSSAMVALYSAL